jgi:predicted ATPase
MINKIQIPDEFIFRSFSYEDVNILIGENGSGKSSLLAELAEIYLHGNISHVIAIANSIHDKFKSKGKRFHALKGSKGRRQAKDTLKKALLNMSHDSEKRINYATRALEYINFDPVVGFKIKFNQDNVEIKKSIDNLELKNNQSEKLFSIIRKYQNNFSNKDNYFNNKYNHYSSNNEDVIWLKMDTYSFLELDKYSLLEIFKWESVLVRSKIIEPIEVFLSKENNAIPLLEASSGELSLITSIIYISSIIDENTVILIDEPENSLHPKWQREYVKTMMDIFHYYQPMFVIATHSPMIISGAELAISKTKIFKAKNFEFLIEHKEPKNIEEIYYNFFDTTTPENRFLSEMLINNLNLLSEQLISLNHFSNFIKVLTNSIVDRKQLEMLKNVEELAHKITLNSTNN